MIKLDNAVDPFDINKSIASSAKKVSGAAHEAVKGAPFQAEQFKHGFRTGKKARNAKHAPARLINGKTNRSLDRGMTAGYYAKPAAKVAGVATVAGGSAYGAHKVSKLSIGRVGDTAMRAKRARGAYKVTNAPGRTRQKFSAKANSAKSKVGTKVNTSRQKIRSPEQWNNAANAAVLGTAGAAVGTAGGVAAYKDHKESQKALAKADFAGISSALKQGYKRVGGKRPKKPEMPGKKLRGEIKRGYKAADNKQAHANSSGYVAGAVANKLKAPAAAAGAVGVGVGGHKMYSDSQENKLYKSMEPEWIEDIEKFRMPSIPNPAVAARGVKSTAGNMTSRSGGAFSKPSLTAKGPAGKVKIGGGLTGAGKAAVGGTAAVGTGGIMSHKKKQGMVGVTKMDPFNVEKAKQKEASTGRKVAGTVFGPAHAAVAGKKGRKLGAVGSSFGHGVVGTTVGSVAGKVAGARLGGAKGMKLGDSVGSLGGGTAGYLRSVKSNQAKGRYKKEPVGKSDVLSAFGVEHVEKKIDKDSVSYKANVVNRDVMHPKFGGNGKYTKPERKRARKVMSRESSKAELKYGSRGAGIGAAAGGVGAGLYGAAKGGAKGAKSHSVVGAVVGGVAGAAGGSKYSEPIGRTNGIKRYQKEIGKSDSLSAFGVEH